MGELKVEKVRLLWVIILGMDWPHLSFLDLVVDVQKHSYTDILIHIILFFTIKKINPRLSALKLAADLVELKGTNNILKNSLKNLTK